MPRARTTSSKRARCKSAAGRPPVGGKFCRCLPVKLERTRKRLAEAKAKGGQHDLIEVYEARVRGLVSMIRRCR